MLAPSEFVNTTGYLNTTTYGLPPKATLRALRRASDQWANRAGWMVWEEDGEECRGLFASLVGVSATNIALMPAVSLAAGLVAASLPVGPGDNIVIHESDFTSTVLAFDALTSRGVEIRRAPLDGLVGAADENTALVAVSLVQSADGRVADIEALARTGARLFVDGSQAVGAVEVDASEIDYFACHAYKWLLCPRGLGFLSIRDDRLHELTPFLSGWKARSDPYERFYGIPDTLTDDARLHDVSLSWFAAAGARESLALILSLGPETIAAHNISLAREFTTALDLDGPESPIVQVTVTDPSKVRERLEAAGVSCAVRDGSIRVAFHLYNDSNDVALAVGELKAAGERNT